MTDPNQWVKSPPSTFVTVNGTSRDSINGCRGLVLQYDDSKSRYLILLCQTQQQVSLKADNLQIAGMIDQAKAYWEMGQNSPDIQRQLQSLTSTIRQKTGMELKTLGMAVIVGFLASSYFLGFTKTMLLLSVLLLLSMILAPDLFSPHANMNTVIQNAPMRWKHFVRENIPSVGSTIADNPMYLSAFTVLVAVVLLLPLLRSNATTNSTKSILLSDDEVNQYYKLGYEDAKANLEFGASLTNVPRTLVEDEEWLPPTPTSSSPFSISTLMAVFAIVRTVYPLGNDGSGIWNWRLALSNVRTLPTWRMGLLAFAVYRLIAAFV